MLGPEVDILPFLLLPLAGPEEFSEEEMDSEWLGRAGGCPPPPCRELSGWGVTGQSLARPPSSSRAHPPGLPVDLQYLPADKQREPDADIRKMLIEAVMLVRGVLARVGAWARGCEWARTCQGTLLSPQLTATAAGRQQVRDQGAYLVLRELHSWEPEPDVKVACEKLIQVCVGLQGLAGHPLWARAHRWPLPHLLPARC